MVLSSGLKGDQYTLKIKKEVDFNRLLYYLKMFVTKMHDFKTRLTIKLTEY
jgi:hypothetical protein